MGRRLKIKGQLEWTVPKTIEALSPKIEELKELLYFASIHRESDAFVQLEEELWNEHFMVSLPLPAIGHSFEFLILNGAYDDTTRGHFSEWSFQTQPSRWKIFPDHGDFSAVCLGFYLLGMDRLREGQVHVVLKRHVTPPFEATCVPEEMSFEGAIRKFHQPDPHFFVSDTKVHKFIRNTDRVLEIARRIIVKDEAFLRMHEAEIWP